MNSFQNLFLLGANVLASIARSAYGPVQNAAGFSKDEWDLLTSESCWTRAEQRKMPSIISSAVSITLQTAGLPATSLPGAFVAATICKLCAPCNRMVAAASAPESFDVISASGIMSESVIKITSKEQMLALVVYFSSAQFGALEQFSVDEVTAAQVIADQAKEQASA